MSIPSQLPQLVTTARSSALQALALQAGQVLDGKVLGPAPGGGTQVEIAGQRLNLLLPTLLAAGATIKLEVQSAGPQIRLALQAPAPAVPAAPSAPQTPVTAPSATVATATSQPVPSVVLPQPAFPIPPPATSPAAGVQPGPPAGASSRVDVAFATGVPTAPNVPGGAVGGGPVPAAGTPDAPVPTSAPAVPNVAGKLAASGSAPVSPAAGGAAPAPASPAPAMPGASIATPVGPPSAVPPAGAAPAAPGAQAVNPQAQAANPATNAPAAAGAGAGQAPAPIAISGPAQAYARQAGPVTLQQVVGVSPATTAPVPQGPAPPAPITGAATASTPQAALAQMVQAAVPRQGSITSLTTALTAIAGKVALPEPVIRAAQQVLAGRLRLDGPPLTGAQLQKAVLGSGLFQEAKLGAGNPAQPQSDMKSALLSLRQSLGAWLGQQAAILPAAKVAPPLRGSVPRARSAELPPLEPASSSAEVGKQLLDRTEAALSRLRLHQNASLPDPAGRQADLSLDLPVTIGQHQALLHLQIHRDAQGQGETETDRSWQMRFAINLPELGEVGAQVSLRGGGAGVMLWAADGETARALEASIADLRHELAASGLQPGAVFVRHGEPPNSPAAPSGHFVDARR